MMKTTTPKRNTKQKKLILCCFSAGHKCTVDGHNHSHLDTFPLMTAEEVEETLQKEGHKVGIATIYRALKELCEAGLVRKYTQSEGSAKYRYIGDEKEKGLQLLCRDCGCVIDTDENDVAETVNKISSKYGFALDISSSLLYGECKSCKGRVAKNEN